MFSGSSSRSVLFAKIFCRCVIVMTTGGSVTSGFSEMSRRDSVSLQLSMVAGSVCSWFDDSLVVHNNAITVTLVHVVHARTQHTKELMIP